MTQITLEIEDEVVRTIGKKKLETKITNWIKDLERKIEIDEAIEELKRIPIFTESDLKEFNLKKSKLKNELLN